MITQYYPPLKAEKPVEALPWHKNSPARRTDEYSYGDILRASKLGITDAEFQRRCRLVRNAFLDCKLYKGDTVYPVRQEDYEKNGAMRVVAITGDYREMTETEWPVNDNPFIVCLESLKPHGGTTFCTNGWATRENKHLKLPLPTEC